MAPNTYVAVSDVLTAYGSQVYSWLDDPQTPVADGDDVSDNDRLLAAIDGANDTVDAYLRGQYTLPLAEVPASVKRAALALVRYDLVQARPELDPDREKMGYDRAIKFFESIAKGEARLDITPTTDTAPPGAPAVAQIGSNRTRSGVERETMTSPSWVSNF